ncbi:MAG: hypothetical protein M3N46_07860 [Actinomycetota bacterium]|nr:hypothetical protein [Actinomycetota bacterium]
MRRSVFAIWIGLLVLALGSATIRFLLFAVQNSVSPNVNLAFSYVVVVIVIVAVWVLTLRFIEGRQRRQAAAMQARYPGSVTFPSLPTHELDASVRLLDPTVELESVDALTILVDAAGVSLRRRGGDSTALLLDIERTRVLDLSSRVAGGRRGGHPMISVVLQSDDGLIPLSFPLFQSRRPFRRATAADAEHLVATAKAALAG